MEEKKNEAYQQLKEISKKAALYSGISGLLEWDLEIFLPKSAVQFRSEQSELIASAIHKEKTSKIFENNLKKFIDLPSGQILDPHLTDQQQANIREWHRDYLRIVKLPPSFIEEFAKTTSLACHVWHEAKEHNQFKLFQPQLEKIIDLCRQKADLLGFEKHPYDALIDEFEPTMTTEVLAVLFERLKIPLMNLLKKIQTQKSPKNLFLNRDFPHDKQLKFGKKILGDMGLDPNCIRLDESLHPMCFPAHPTDIRLTTKIYPNRMYSNFLSCLHEGGHGLYHFHLPVEHFGTPLGEPASLAIDESQSRTWETIIGHSLPFLEHYFPLLQETFSEQLSDIRTEDFYRAINHSTPSLIRIESDEITYNLHIMVRFEIERALLDRSLSVSEIPEAWNEKMRTYFGIVPKADSEGCLQDIHWSYGLLGYFPTYALGNLYAAQFFETFTHSHPNWKERLAKGDLKFLSNWQKKEIHQFGRKYLPEDLCEKVTGKPLSEKPFIEYLESKYFPLYHLS